MHHTRKPSVWRYLLTLSNSSICHSYEYIIRSFEASMHTHHCRFFNRKCSGAGVNLLIVIRDNGVKGEENNEEEENLYWMEDVGGTTV